MGVQVVVGEQGSAMSWPAPWAHRNFAAAPSASCGSNGLPPGGAKMAQLPGWIWTRPTMPLSWGTNILGSRPKSDSSFSRPARTLQSRPQPEAAAACRSSHWSSGRSVPASPTSDVTAPGHAASAMTSIEATSSTSAASTPASHATSLRPVAFELVIGTAVPSIIPPMPSRHG